MHFCPLRCIMHSISSILKKWINTKPSKTSNRWQDQIYDRWEGRCVGPDSPEAQTWSTFWSPSLFPSVLSHSLPARWYIICQRYNQHCAQMSERSSDTWIVRMLVLSRPHVEWDLGGVGWDPFSPSQSTPQLSKGSHRFILEQLFAGTLSELYPPLCITGNQQLTWDWCLRTEHGA